MHETLNAQEAAPTVQAAVSRHFTAPPAAPRGIESDTRFGAAAPSISARSQRNGHYTTASLHNASLSKSTLGDSSSVRRMYTADFNTKGSHNSTFGIRDASFADSLMEKQTAVTGRTAAQSREQSQDLISLPDFSLPLFNASSGNRQRYDSMIGSEMQSTTGGGLESCGNRLASLWSVTTSIGGGNASPLAGGFGGAQKSLQGIKVGNMQWPGLLKGHQSPVRQLSGVEYTSFDTLIMNRSGRKDVDLKAIFGTTSGKVSARSPKKEKMPTLKEDESVTKRSVCSSAISSPIRTGRPMVPTRNAPAPAHRGRASSLSNSSYDGGRRSRRAAPPVRSRSLVGRRRSPRTPRHKRYHPAPSVSSQAYHYGGYSYGHRDSISRPTFVDPRRFGGGQQFTPAPPPRCHGGCHHRGGCCRVGAAGRVGGGGVSGGMGNMQLYGGMAGVNGNGGHPMALSAVASRSMLTCNREFQRCYPNVYQGLCKGLIDVNRLVSQEVVIPIKEEVSLHESSIRSRWAVTAAISEHLWKAVHGKFPDPKVAPRLVRKVAEYLYDKIEAGVQEAEDERSVLQWLLRFDVENGVDVRVTTSMVVGLNSTIANIEGAAHIRRKKGNMLGLVSKDLIVVDLDVVVKCLFLNGGQLTEIDNDPLFSDCIMAGENRFAAQFLLS